VVEFGQQELPSFQWQNGTSALQYGQAMTAPHAPCYMLKRDCQGNFPAKDTSDQQVFFSYQALFHHHVTL
jgi:hypothetical protein